MKHFAHIILAAALLCGIDAAAQTTKVRGRVFDAATGEVMPLVSVAFTGTSVGITTDFEGNYSLETREKVTSLTVGYIAYQTQTLPLNPGAFNQIDVKLVAHENRIEAIVVKRGEDPAIGVLRNVSKNKKKNNPDHYPTYHCATYTKMELDMANVGSEFRNKRMQRNFGFVFEYMDTAAITGKAYLPMMITEATADYYYRRNPRLSREIIQASRISGIEEDFTFAQFTGQLHAKVNLYDDFINIFNVNFVSPLHDQGTLYYKYYLVDSLQQNGRKVYKIRFHPRGKSVPVFDGEVGIDSLSWGLVSASMRLAKNLNVNWIKDMAVETTQQLAGDTLWFPLQDKILADFAVQLKDSSKLATFMGQRQVDYRLVSIGEEIPPEVDKLHTDVVMERDVLNSDEAYWQQVRPYQLSEREQGIYNMVDSIRHVPLFNTFYDAMNTVVFGYLKTGPWLELGPYYKLYSFNGFEGNRFQIGARTTGDWNKKLRLTGFLAYGTKDRELKGGLEAEYMFNTMPTSKLHLYVRRDAFPLGVGQGAFTSGNILGSLFSRGSTNKMTLENSGGVSWEKEWVDGVSNKFGFAYRQMFANPVVDFIRPDGTKLERINSAEIRVGTRLSHNEMVMRGYFDKSSMPSVYPVLSVNLSGGMKGILDCDYDYLRAEASIQYNPDINPIGRSMIILSGGKIFGRIPYPLLKLHEGNSTYFYDLYAFSCMNYYEFASDVWASAIWEHHFNGFFLGRIPLMKKLKWREVITAKALWGDLSARNDGSLPGTQAELFFPYGMSRVSTPYFEAGAGIENIFRIFRIDAFWRLTHREGRPPQDNFAVNFSFAITF